MTEYAWTVESEEVVMPENGQKVWEGDWLSGDEVGYTGLWVSCLQVIPAHVDTEVFRRAISLTLNELPILASRIETEKRLGYPTPQPCFTRELKGAVFIAASLRLKQNARSFEELMDKGTFLEKTNFMTNAAGAKYPPSMFADPKKPLLILQLTHTSNGQSIVAINISHCIGDAYCITRVLKAIDAYCSRDPRVPVTSFSRLRSPRPIAGTVEEFLRGICENAPVIHGQRFSVWRMIAHAFWSVLFGHSLKLRVNMAKLQALKARLNAEGGGDLSTNDVLSAILIRGLRPSRPYMQLAINTRNRASYFPTADYFGNAIGTARFRVDAAFPNEQGSLVENAKTLHQLIRQKIAPDLLSKSFYYADHTAFEGNPIYFGRDFVVSDPAQRTITLNSWAVYQRDLYSVAYGTGCTPIGMPYSFSMEGLIHIMPEYANGDLAVHLNVSKEERSRLLRYLSDADLEAVLYPVDGTT